MNLLKQRLNKGKFALGTMLSEITTPNIPRILAAGGFDFIIIDCEHGYFDYSQVAAIVGIANGIHLPVIIRIPEIRRECITKYMDIGADGLLVPMTGTKEDIQRVVAYAKYAPVGKRGLSTQRAHTNYNPPPLTDYMREANNRTIIFAQIESREGVTNIDEILGVEGVDAALMGPNDLASDLGTPGNFDTEEMQGSINAVITAANRIGKPCGIISSKIPFLQDCQAKGMSVLSCNSEVGMIMNSAKRIVKEFTD